MKKRKNYYAVKQISGYIALDKSPWAQYNQIFILWCLCSSRL